MDEQVEQVTEEDDRGVRFMAEAMAEAVSEALWTVTATAEGNTVMVERHGSSATEDGVFRVTVERVR